MTAPAKATLSSGLLVAAWLALGPAEDVAARPRAGGDASVPPNVVFVLADDLGYGEVGVYGQKKIRTPSIDRLAAGGMRLTRHYAGSAVCAPSRSVLLTGLHPGHTPIRDNEEVQPEGQWPLPASAITLAERFKARGYVTAAMGKWGLGPPGSEGDPLAQGFDRFYGYNCQRHAHNHYPAFLHEDGRRVALRNPDFSPHQPLAAGTDASDPKAYERFAGPDYAPDLTWEKARAFVRENRDRPFFLFVPTTVPHLALQVPAGSLAEYRGAFPETPYGGEKQYLPAPFPRAAYAAMVTRMDREVGRMLDLLRELGLEERTIVVFTSDNGPTFGVGGADSAFFASAAGLRGLKGSLYEGGVRVPAVVRWPGLVAPGSTSDRVTGFEDWVPTLLELTGAEAPAGIDGISFAETLRGRPQEPRPFLYREFPGYGGQQSVLAGDWKAVRQGLDRSASRGPSTDLYDLARDPGETTDLAARRPDVVARLEGIMAREHTRSEMFPIPAIDGRDAAYTARRTDAARDALLRAADEAWSAAVPVTWGPEPLATSFRALWDAEALFVRFDVTDEAPWHTMTRRDDEIWNEEVVELFLDVGATVREYAELEISPANVVVDLWVEPGSNRYDKAWDIDGLETRVVPRADASGRATGWIATARVPWRALRSRAPREVALPPRPGDRWRFNVYRIERPHGPADPGREPVFLAWSPTGRKTFHVPQAFRDLTFEDRARPAPPAAAACQEETRLAMGCACTVRVCGIAPGDAARAAAAALDEIDRVDRLLSHYRPDSPISRLNREAARGPVPVDAELFDLLALCQRWSRESAGAFDATVLPLVRTWGFFRGEGRLPSAGEVDEARSRVGAVHVVLDPAARTVRFDGRGVGLDLGGIGKGYAVDRAVAVLRTRGVASALVSAGGSSVFGLGAPPGQAAWSVGLEDPAHPPRALEPVRLRDRALSVSGRSVRAFEKDGVVYGHVLDPRTGWPVQGVLAVAVTSPDATTGDALDNAVFVLGPESGRDLVRRHPGVEASVFLAAGPGASRRVDLR